MDLISTDVKGLVDSIKKGEITSESLVLRLIENIEKYEDKVCAYLYIDKEGALEKARKIDERVKNGKSLGELAGIPISIKDNICTIDMPTTCASKMLEGFMSAYDATIVQKLRDEDAIIIGKLNMDEFAMGSNTDTSYYKKTRNPYDLEKSPGGSSGGCAAALAADMTLVTIGTDTGGSVRQPASYCGVYAIKPTYGTISRYGIVPYASSLDQAGPMARSAEDLAYLYDILSFHDQKDTTSLKVDRKKTYDLLNQDLKGKKIAIVEDFRSDVTSKEVVDAIEKASENFKSMGFEVSHINIENVEYSLPVYYILSCAEASSNLSRFSSIIFGHRAEEFSDLESLYKNSRGEGFGMEVKRRIFLGTYALSSGYYDAYYKKSLKARRIIKESFAKVFENFDVILTPTSLTTATNLGEKNTDPVKRYMTDLFTVPVNIAGIPAISMPCSSDKDGMPIGMQLMGNYLSEDLLLAMSYQYSKKFKDELPAKAVI